MKNKVCKNCGLEIKEKVKKCPNCNKDLRNTYAIIALIISLLGCLFSFLNASFLGIPLTCIAFICAIYALIKK